MLMEAAAVGAVRRRSSTTAQRGYLRTAVCGIDQADVTIAALHISNRNAVVEWPAERPLPSYMQSP